MVARGHGTRWAGGLLRHMGPSGGVRSVRAPAPCGRPGPRLLGREERFAVLGRRRPRQQVALAVLPTDAPQRIQLRLAVDSLGDAGRCCSSPSVWCSSHSSARRLPAAHGPARHQPLHPRVRSRPFLRQARRCAITRTCPGPTSRARPIGSARPRCPQGTTFELSGFLRFCAEGMP